MSAVGASLGADDRMLLEAARQLSDDSVCLVGIGLPSRAATLARATHAPDAVLVYESGPIGSRPLHPPLSIGDGELADTALDIVSMAEMFNYWLQGGLINVGFLGAAQIDRYGNLNTTVIGDYATPRTRLPGGGGAPEIAMHCDRVIVVMRQGPRSFVDRLDFVTAPGHIDGGTSRADLGMAKGGPQVVITDLGVLRPDPTTKELTLVALHPGVELDEVRDATGWELRVADRLERTAPPDADEEMALEQLRTGRPEERSEGPPQGSREETR